MKTAIAHLMHDLNPSVEDQRTLVGKRKEPKGGWVVTYITPVDLEYIHSLRNSKEKSILAGYFSGGFKEYDQHTRRPPHPSGQLQLSFLAKV
jgi:hypothetical protein